jgi:hypothetical protein
VEAPQDELRNRETHRGSLDRIMQTPDLTFFSPKVEKRNSRIHGRGLFAKQWIEAAKSSS